MVRRATELEVLVVSCNSWSESRAVPAAEVARQQEEDREEDQQVGLWRPPTW